MTIPYMPVVGISIDPYGGFIVQLGSEESWVPTRAEANAALDDFTDAWYAGHGPGEREVA